MEDRHRNMIEEREIYINKATEAIKNNNSKDAQYFMNMANDIEDMLYDEDITNF